MIEAKKKAAGEVSNGLSDIWLPFVDTYRTMCRAPEPGFKRVLEGVRDMRLAA